MSSNADEPQFVDDILITGDEPSCYGNFERLDQRSNGCMQCPLFNNCRSWTFVRAKESDQHVDRLESDPNGLDQHAPGAKLDAGKTRLWLVFSGFANALEEVGKVGTFGAKKHCDDGWKSVPDGYARYSSAMLRHIMKEARGEAIDPDFGLLHAAHTAWNALARLELLLAESHHLG